MSSWALTKTTILGLIIVPSNPVSGGKGSENCYKCWSRDPSPTSSSNSFFSWSSFSVVRCWVFLCPHANSYLLKSLIRFQVPQMPWKLFARLEVSTSEKLNIYEIMGKNLLLCLQHSTSYRR